MSGFIEFEKRNEELWKTAIATKGEHDSSLDRWKKFVSSVASNDDSCVVREIAEMDCLKVTSIERVDIPPVISAVEEFPLDNDDFDCDSVRLMNDDDFDKSRVEDEPTTENHAEFVDKSAEVKPLEAETVKLNEGTKDPCNVERKMKQVNDSDVGKIGCNAEVTYADSGIANETINVTTAHVPFISGSSVKRETSNFSNKAPSGQHRKFKGTPRPYGYKGGRGFSEHDLNFEGFRLFGRQCDDNGRQYDGSSRRCFEMRGRNFPRSDAQYGYPRRH